MGGRGFGSGGRSRSIGLRVKIGHKIGKAPFSSKAQNEQVRSISKQLNLDVNQQTQLHREISGQGYSFQEILAIAKDMFKK
ncbi:hypothetical protein CE91St36_06140 [Christensenellaceae bacterium]|nr:hypothetical protein CE91St36_06140 [Christensenellaceae bacterium]BDF60465.1 hypothetical protein CE91St37_06150 [Christensenellaceae bacterium]